jgi:hypothetical protein
MIYVNYRGRLGNNLFQWAFGRVLSKLSGSPLCVPRLRLFPVTSGRMHWGVSHLFSRVIRGRAPGTPRIPFFPVSRPKYELPPADRIRHTYESESTPASTEEWVEKARQGDILINGFPHRLSLFEPHASWLIPELTPKDGDFTPARADDIVIHIRWGDFFEQADHIGVFSYPIDAMPRLLAQLKYDRCLIVTDTVDSPLAQTLVKESRGVVVSKDMAHDYRTLYHAPRIILSPSTFSWWAAWTGKAREIYQPYEMGIWKKENGVDLDLKGSHVHRYNADGQIID